jgi:hypothetical protein
MYRTICGPAKGHGVGRGELGLTYPALWQQATWRPVRTVHLSIFKWIFPLCFEFKFCLGLNSVQTKDLNEFESNTLIQVGNLSEDYKFN